MVLERFGPFVLVVANLTLVLFLIGMDDHVHEERTFCVEPQVAVRAYVNGCAVGVLVCLK
jgi:hypothetical protein